MDVAQMWSGGKDSTCAGYKHLERGDNVHFISYIPMFDKDIPLIEKCHYDFLMNLAEYFRSQGAQVTFTNGGLTYWDYCTKILVKGSRVGNMQQYPCYIKGKCGFNRDSKTPACNEVAKTLKWDFKDVGLCADETDRKQLLPDEMSILQELGITKQMAFDFCKNSGFLLSPSYKSKKRDGCTLCPNAKAIERVKWFEDYKEYNAKERLLELQRILVNDSVQKGGKQFYPLRGHRYFIENEEFIPPNGTNCYLFGDVIN